VDEHEAAVNAAARFDWDRCRMQPWQVDEAAPVQVCYFRVDMYPDGRLRGIPAKEVYDADRPPPALGQIVARKAREGGWRSLYIQTDEAQLAVKVANERRAQLLATNQWLEDPHA